MPSFSVFPPAVWVFLRRVAIFALPLLLVPAANWYMDPYGLFNDNVQYGQTASNSRYKKMKRLLETPDTSFHVLLMGSSRVERIDLARKHGKRFYNLTTSVNLTSEWLYDMQLLWDAGYRIDTLYAGVDWFHLFRTPAENVNYTTFPYYRSAWDRNKVFIRFLAHIPTLAEINAFRNKKTITQVSENDYAVDYQRTGTFTADPAEGLSNFGADHAAKIIFLNIKKDAGSLAARTQAVLKDVADLQTACREHGTVLVLFANPSFVNHYLSYWPHSFIDMKKQLAQQNGLYDFSIQNDITRTPAYWVEDIHYRLNVGDRMILRWTLPPAQCQAWGLPASFGYYATAATADSLYAAEHQAIYPVAGQHS